MVYMSPPKWFLIKCGNPWNMVWFLKTCFGLNLLILLVKHVEIHVWFLTNLTLYWWSNLIFLLEEKISIKGFCEEWRLSICSYFPSKGSGFILCKSYLYIIPSFSCNIFVCNFPTVCFRSWGYRDPWNKLGWSWKRRCEDEVAILAALIIFNLAFRVILSFGSVVCLNLVKNFMFPVYRAYVTLS